MLKGPAENKRKRKLWGGTRGQTELDVLGGNVGWGGWEPGGRGAPRENESIPGDRAWEGCSEDAHDCFKVPLYIVNEAGSTGILGLFLSVQKENLYSS